MSTIRNIEPKVTPVKYQVSILTKENCLISDYYHYALNIERVDESKDLWAIRSLGVRYSRSGKPGYEPIPSSRTEYYKKSHSFTFEEAVALAKKLAPNVEINGRKAKSFLNS